MSCVCGDTECPSCGTAQGTRTPTTLAEKAERLLELKDTIRELLDEAQDLLRGTPEEDRARCYWYAHIRMALDDDHTWLGRSMCTMQSSINALEAVSEEKDNDD